MNFKTLCLTACVWLAFPAMAANQTPAGAWKTISDDGRTEKSIVQIYDKEGKLYGRVVHIFNPPVPNPLCLKCRGGRKNKPVMGMVILWNMSRQGDAWAGGTILDPENGNEYKCILRLEQGGQRLDVHGYVGIPLFGRSQHWIRVDSPGGAS